MEHIRPIPPEGEHQMRLATLRQRLRNDEGGFTLIELLVVLVIIGILLAIAVPSYLGFKDRANQRAAESDARSAVPSAEAFYSDNNTYANLSVAALTAIDSGLSSAVAVGNATLSGYCLSATVGGKNAYFHGPGGVVMQTKNAAC
jgi:type IV pilus assembly protein PilA